jgi:cell division protease FtsH
MDGTFQRDCSEHTAEEIDLEVKRILDSSYTDAKNILDEHRQQLERVTAELLKRETLDAEEFSRLIGHQVFKEERPGPPVDAAPVSSTKI